MQEYNPEETSEKDGCTSDSDGNGKLRKLVKHRNEPEVCRSPGANKSTTVADEEEPFTSQSGGMVTKRRTIAIEDDPNKIRSKEEPYSGHHEDKADKVPNSTEEKKTYDPHPTLTRSWTGIGYQLQHLIFTLLCALQQKDFSLATEMVAADKLDDVVLLYKDVSGTQVGRFVQIKYTSINDRMITAKQLLDEGGNFSVPSYFTSWRKVKKNELFRNIEVRNMILCTNMDLDTKDLEKNNIYFKNTGEPDECFELKSAVKRTAWFKFTIYEESNKKLYHKLRESSDVYRLPKTVANCIYDKKPMRLEKQIFKDYHIALKKYVFDDEIKKFRDKFIQNLDLPQKVQMFRDIFLTEFGKSSGIDPSAETIWKEIQTRFEKLKFRRDFGKAPEGATDSLREYELPNDYVDDAEISNFLEDFTLAVNQPSEDELNRIIKAKMGAISGFNLSNTEPLHSAFQKKIWDSLLKTDNQQKGKEYLSHKVCATMLKDSSNEISSLVTRGMDSIYCEQMKEYNVHFKFPMQRVKAFVSEDKPSNRVMELVAPGKTLLTALWVYDTLEQIPKYKKMDSFIFTHVKSLKLTGTSNFASQLYPNLLIVDCGSNSAEQYLQTLWNPLCNIIAENVDKRMIVITQIGKELGTQFKLNREFYREKKENLSFHNLINDSQRKLLEKPVTTFQGHKNETSFGELLGICKSDNLSADESENLLNVIDSDTLVEMIRSDEVEIGGDLEGLDEIANYYINRTICRHVHIKETIFKDKKLPDLLAISGINRVFAGVSVQTVETPPMIQNSTTDLFADSGIETSSMALSSRNLTILADNREEEQFNALCTDNKDRNVHWLKREQGRCVWKRSQGDITHLLQHREATLCEENNDIKFAAYLSEDELTAHKEPVIISDIAGMGKSTMLTHLAWKIKGKEPDMLVLKFNLNHHTTALAEVKQKSNYDLGNINGVLQFLVKELLSRETKFAQKVFRRIMERKHKVVLIFDDFDEICPTYESIVIDLLKTLADYGIRKLFVATRPHTRVALETKLNAFSYTIQPLSTNAQKRFLIDFWKAKFKDTDHDSKRTIENRIEIYTTAILKKLANSSKDQGNKFTGVPLQAKLVAEIFENHSEGLRENFYSCEEFIFSEIDEPKFPEKINLIYVYKRLMEKKFDISFNKRGGNLADIAVLEDKRQRYKKFVDKHKRLALDTLFDKDKTKQLLSQQNANYRALKSTDTDISVERDGIITEFIDGEPRFGHITYAEYFAANFFSDMLRKRKQNESFIRVFVADVLLAEKYKTTRTLIDWLLSDKHVSVVQGKYWKLHIKMHRSQFNKTIFHVAAAEGNHHIIKLFLNCPCENSEDRKNPIQTKDLWQNRSTLHSRIRTFRHNKIASRKHRRPIGRVYSILLMTI